MADLTITASNVVVADSKPRVLYGSCGETITAGHAVYLAAATKKWMRADSNSPEAEVRQAIGIALNGGSLNQPIQVLQRGKIRIGATLVPGSGYYLSNNPGGICLASDVVTGDYICLLGLALSATVLDVAIQFPNVITGGVIAPSAINLQTAQSLAAIGQAASTTVSSGLSAQTIQFFDRLITMPSSARQTSYSTLIDGLVTAGVWAKLDALFLYAASDTATSLINLVQDPHKGFLDIATGVMTFTADMGWSGGAAPGQRDVNSNFNPSTAGGNYSQNDALMCVWQTGTTQENRTIIDDTSSDSHVELWPKYTDGHTYWAINGNGTEVSSTAPSSAQGFWLMQRTGASAVELRLNDAVIGTSTLGSASLVNQFLISAPIANNVSCLGIGASLSSAQQTAFYNSVRSYMTDVGVP